jgi:hypothetical protein
MFVDAGDYTGNDDEPGRRQTTALIEAMKALDYRVANLSRREFLHGFETFQERREQVEFPFVTANLVWQDSGKAIAEPYHIEKVDLRNGAAVSSVRIGFLGLSESDPTFLHDGPDGRRIVTSDPLVAAANHIPKLADKADIIVVLSSLELETARRLAHRVEGIDLIIGGHGVRRTRSTDFPEDTLIGTTRIMYIGDQGKNLGEVRLKLDDEGAVVSAQRTVVGLTKDWPSDETLAALMASTRKSINEWNRQQASAANPFAAAPAGNRPIFTGSERCAPCHEKEFQTWSDSGHAHAFDTLVEASQDFNPNCVRCHTVGFRRKSGFVNSNATPALKHVGCEACHGPSSRHPDEELTGYGRTNVRMCVTCHTRENSPEFDPAAYVPRILHWEQPTTARK